MKFVIALSTLLLCLVTLSSSVLFWISMPADIYGKLLAGVTATALECCKYSFFPAGIFYLKKRNLGGAGLLLVGVVLLFISVAATTGFLENAYSQHAQSTQQNTLEYQTKKQQLNSLQQQIDTLNGLLAADAAGSYRTRALDTVQKIKILEDQRNTSLDQIKIYRESPQGNAQSFFSVLATPLAISPEKARQVAFMGLALIVDICAIAALLALGGMGKEFPQQPTQKQPSTTHAHAQKQQQQKPVIRKSGNESLTEKENILAREILAGTYGQPISVRNVIAQARTGHPTVKKILDNLIDKNQVRRNGKKFELVHNLIELERVA